MIASWMLYALCVGALISLAAVAAERTLVALGRPTRFVWGAALLLSALWPLGSTIARLFPAPARAVRVMPFTIVVGAPSPSADEVAAAARAVMIDRALIAIWLVVSALLLWRLARGALLLERARRAWQRSRVNGVPVQISENVGPAVVGLRSMDVVLPRWILSLDEPLREIVLRHEEEHRSARDPYLLFGAAALVALMPWNVALWVLARRLRLAIEMDCDARVLRAHPSPERYGMLILTIAQRRSVAPTLFAPMLSEPTTNLERRILAMRTTKQMARWSAYAGGLVTVGVLAFASSLQSATARPRAGARTLVAAVVPETIPVTKKAPAKKTSAKPGAKPTAKKTVEVGLDSGRTSPPAGSGSSSSAATAATDGPKMVNPNQTFFEFQIEEPAKPLQGNKGPRYPDELREAHVEGVVLAQVVVDQEGHPIMDTFKVLKSDHELFTQATREALADFQFSPARVGGVAVKQLIQMPFQFSLSKNP